MMNNFIFFGTDDFSIEVLKVLLEKGFKPSFCVTQPDRPKGRNLVLTPPDIKVFCEKEEIKVLQFEKLEASEIPEVDFYVVASYGKIIPKDIVEKPKLGALNVHPSLLPKYRGSTPIETAILNDDKNTGVSIIFMDEKMDHGPIIEQTETTFADWPTKIEIRNQLAQTGGEMLVKILGEFLSQQSIVKSQKQNHEEATFTKMLKKSDGLLEVNSQQSTVKSEREKYLKYLAYTPWPGTFFFIEKNEKKIRVKITEAVWEENKFQIKKVIPESKSEMTFESFSSGFLE